MSEPVHYINVHAANTNLVGRSILGNTEYSTQIVCDEGYSVYEITIKMGGVDITSTAYDPTYNMISIASVTDDVDIECYAMHTMPSDYVRVDGIKNPSNAWMNTEYTPTATSRLEIEYAKQGTSSCILAGRASGQTTIKSTSIFYSGNYLRVTIVAKNASSYVVQNIAQPSDGARFSCVINNYNGNVYYNGSSVKSFTRDNVADTRALCLFSRLSGEEASDSVGSICYLLRFFDYGTHSYERYYIPCLNASGVAGFWDAARGVFQGSSNSTAFEACYTQRGLVFQLDGINKGATADAWTDLVGGYVFANNGAISQDNGWQIDNGKYLKRAPGISMDVHNNYTVEVCVTPTSAPPHMVFVLNNKSNQNQPLFMINTGNIVTFIQNVRTCTFPSYAANNSHCISINYNRGCHNGLIVANYGSSDYWNSSSDESFIGRRNSSTPHPFKGVIHAIRIYNRRLTLEEMKFNQRIDNKRFNLGLTI